MISEQFATALAAYGIDFWLLAILSALIVAISKSGFGGGMGALSAPLLLLVLPPQEALAILLPIFLVTDVFVVWQWRHFGVWRLILPMVLFASIGQLLGWWFMHLVNETALVVMIALIALASGGQYYLTLFFSQRASAAAQQHSDRRSIRRKRRQIGARASVWCSLSGVSSFVSLTGGIPVQIFILPLRLPRQFVVGTLAWYFLIINASKVPFYGQLALFSPSSIMISLCLLPILPFGIVLGKWLNRTMSDKVFYHLSYGFLIVLGLRLIYQVLI